MKMSSVFDRCAIVAPMLTTPLRVFTCFLAVTTATVCGGKKEDSPTERASVVGQKTAVETAAVERSGQWYRSQLDFGQDLPKLFFFLELPDGDSGAATVQNGSETMSLAFSKTGDDMRMTADWSYKSVIEAKQSSDGVLRGRWVRDTPLWGEVVLPFVAEPIVKPDPETRYPGEPSVVTITGFWQLTFEHHGPSRARFDQSGDVVTGFIRPGNLGDLRFLAGNVRARELIMSTFNGNVANVVRAEIAEDGKTLSGEVSLQTRWNEKFTGRRVDELPEENPVSLAAGKSRLTAGPLERVKGSPALAIFFATWCSSCNDAFPAIMALRQKYPGVKTLGIVYDLSEDDAATGRQIEHFRGKYGVDFDLVPVPTTPEGWASAMPPELEGWDGFPIFAFLDADGTVRHMWGGWYGPAAPEQNAKLRRQFDVWMKELATL